MFPTARLQWLLFIKAAFSSRMLQLTSLFALKDNLDHEDVTQILDRGQ